MYKERRIGLEEEKTGPSAGADPGGAGGYQLCDFFADISVSRRPCAQYVYCRRDHAHGGTGGGNQGRTGPQRSAADPVSPLAAELSAGRLRKILYAEQAGDGTASGAALAYGEADPAFHGPDAASGSASWYAVRSL